MKKTLMLCLFALAILSVCFLAYGMEDSDATEGTIYYDSNQNEYIVNDGVLTISKGSAGTGVMGNWSYGHYVTDLVGGGYTSVIIEDGITYVDGLRSSVGLTSVTLPDSVTSLNGFYQLSSMVITGSLPSGLTSIGVNAFYGCSQVAFTGSIPNTVTSIGSGAFNGCTNLALTGTLPSGLTDIGSYAFASCPNLALTGTLPSGLTSIPDYMFYLCTNLALTGTLPSGLTSIGNSCFAKCTNLTLTGTLPSGLTSLGNEVFWDCTKITIDGTLPSGLTTIGTRTFAGCSEIEEYTLPSTVTSVGGYAFTVANLVIVMIGNEPPTIESNSFNANAVTIYVPWSADHSVLNTYKTATNWSNYANSIFERPAPTYVVTFKSQDGTETLQTGSVSYGETATYSGTTPTKTNTAQYTFAFVGWNTSPNQTFDNAVLTNITTDKTFYSAFSETLNTYTVTFDANGGSPTPTAQTVNYGSTATEPTEPTKTGQTFGGWFNGGTTFDFSTPIVANITLTAHWNPNTYTVTFESDGGSSVPSQTVTYGQTATEPTSPTKDGYTFGGWYNGSTVFDFSTPIVANITLTAHWTVVPTPEPEPEQKTESTEFNPIIVAILVLVGLGIVFFLTMRNKRGN